MALASEHFQGTSSDAAVALCCTHFGYSAGYMKENLKKNIAGSVSILNPNRAMADFLLNLCSETSEKKTGSDVELKVVSRIPWNEEKIQAIGTIIEKTSPLTVKALRDYSLLPDLFSW